MAEEKTRKLKQVATTLNIGIATIVNFLSARGFDVDNKPTTKITSEQFDVLAKEFASSMQDKLDAEELNIGNKPQNKKILANSSSPINMRKSTRKDILFTRFHNLIHQVDNNSTLAFEGFYDEILLHTIIRKNYTYQLKNVATALDTNVPIIVAVLGQNGHKVENKGTTKISEDQLRVLAEHFAIELDNAITLSGTFSFDNENYFEALIKYPFRPRYSSQTRLEFLKFKARKRPIKKVFQDIKTRIHSIITPKLFHVFTGKKTVELLNHTIVASLL